MSTFATASPPPPEADRTGAAMRTSISSADWWPSLRGKLLRAGSVRGARAVAILAGLACTAGLVQAAHPFPSPLLPSTVSGTVLEPYDIPPVVGAAPLHFVEPAYSLWAEPGSAGGTLASPSGPVYTSLPLGLAARRASLP